MTSSGLNCFTDIYCINKEIDNTAVNSATSKLIQLTQVFNTNGVLLEETDEDISTCNFGKGVYIIRQNNQTKKSGISRLITNLLNMINISPVAFFPGRGDMFKVV